MYVDFMNVKSKYTLSLVGTYRVCLYKSSKVTLIVHNITSSLRA